MYKANLPYKVKAQWLVPVMTKVNGVNKISYSDGEFFGCHMKTYGGREQTVNDVYNIIEQWTVETYYDPRVNGQYRIRLLHDNSVWELLNSPENVEMSNKFMLMKIERVKNG